MGIVLKYVRKVIPTMTTPHTAFAGALASGRRHAVGRDISEYTKTTTPNATALYQYTSGTTGRSKGAELSHIGILANMEQAKAMTSDVLNEDGEVVMVALPLYHTTAFVLLFVSGSCDGRPYDPSAKPVARLQFEATLENTGLPWLHGYRTR
eukprot:TRINITY_DN15921_c0_g1_i1.p1 TRINITY_DN15921_c0_g1~~TRINITY_DN15921_c0_g1_i1.p1  ORF type:complete len:152 (+),score=0.22 TRINITY_DN15921_c0_g1_i1:234-689(+)